MAKHLLGEFIVLVIGGAVAFGCGGQGDSVPTGRASDSAQSNNVGAEHTSASAALVLFRDPNGTGPRLDVYDVGGNVAVSVSAPIGTEIPETRPEATLTEVYRALHSNASSVPSELSALDLRIEPFLKNITALSVAPPTAIVDKSQSAFNSILCKDFGLSQFSYYHPVLCNWGPASHDNQLYLGDTGNGAPYIVQPNDRVYGWNNTSSAGEVQWYKDYEVGPFYDFPLSAYTYTWTTVYGGGPYGAETEEYSVRTGDLGVTRHVLVQIVK
jgi:hypothetical protein